MYASDHSPQSKLSLGDTTQDFIVMSMHHEPSVRAQGVRGLLLASPATPEEAVSIPPKRFQVSCSRTCRLRSSPVLLHAYRIQRRSFLSPFMSNQHDYSNLFLPPTIS